MIVVDCSVIANFWIKGEFTEIAQQVFKKDPAWVAPLLWRSEFRNVLLKYHRYKALELSTVLRTAATAETFFRKREYSVQSQSILELSSRLGCSAYDGEYLALAQQLNIHLITLDRPLARLSLGLSVEAGQFVK